MIKNLKVENFKSIKNLNISCTKFNIFIGDPNVGKSNILEALGLFSSYLYAEYSQDKKIISKDFVRYDDLSNLFYNGDLSEKISVSIGDYKLQLSADGDEISYTIYKLSSNNEYTGDKKSKQQNRIMTSFQTKLNFFGDYLSLFNHSKQTQLKLPLIKKYKHLEKEKFGFKQFSFLLPPFGSNLLVLLNTNASLLQDFNDILENFDLKLMLRTTEGKIECVRDIKGKLIAIPLKAIAETFHQLFLLLGAIETNKDSVLIFEEPETHMFPKYAKYIAEMMVNDYGNNQYFISTHNPYFLLSMIEKAKKEDISVFAVSYQKYKTVVNKLTAKDIQNILEAEDPFFNIDKYLGE